MVKFSVEGDEDGNEEEPSNNRRLTKKPRTSIDPVAHTSTSNSGASASKARNLASTSTSPSVRESRLEKQDLMEDVGVGGFPLVYSDDSSDDQSIDLDEGQLHLYLSENWVNSTPNGIGKGPKPPSLTLIDPDVLDCAICFEPLNPPVYQCENGHIACASCCTNMQNKCASCSMPIGYNRCRAIEKVLESIRISCPNKQYGCTASLSYSTKLYHERTCSFAHCSCPYPDCTYFNVSTYVYFHFHRQHTSSSQTFWYDDTLSVSLDNGQNHAFFQTRCLRTLFVLNRCIEPRGSFINVVCIAPALSDSRFLYEVSATDGGVSSIKLKTYAEVTPQWTGQPPTDKRCLFVPNDFVTKGGQLKLELTISRDSVYSTRFEASEFGFLFG